MLTARFQALGTASKPKKRRQKKKTVASTSQLGSSQPAVVSVTGSSRRRRNKNRGTVNAGVGTITLQRREYLREVKVGASGKVKIDYIDIVPAELTFLKQFSMFDRIKWNKLHLFYKPGVGANYNGFVSYGINWSFVHSMPSDRAGVSALTPNMSHAIWVDGENRPIVCPQAKLQTRPWFTPLDSKDDAEKGPGRIIVAAESPSNNATTEAIVGELWVDYSVTMTGSSF